MNAKEILYKLETFLARNNKIQIKPEQEGVISLDEIACTDCIIAEWDINQGFLLSPNEDWLVHCISNTPTDIRLERKWPWDRATLERMSESGIFFYSQINVLVFLMYIYEKFPEIKDIVDNKTITDIWEELERMNINENKDGICK